MTATPTSACKCGHEREKHSGTLDHDGYCAAWIRNDLEYCPCCLFQPSDPAPAKVSLPVNQWPDGKPPAPTKEERYCLTCGGELFGKEHGSCNRAPSPSIEEIVGEATERFKNVQFVKEEISNPQYGGFLSFLREKLASIEKAAGDRAYQEASEKAGHHFLYEVIPAEKEASYKEGEKAGFESGRSYERVFRQLEASGKIEKAVEDFRAGAIKAVEEAQSQGHDWESKDPKSRHLIIREEVLETLKTLTP